MFPGQRTHPELFRRKHVFKSYRNDAGTLQNKARGKSRCSKKKIAYSCTHAAHMGSECSCELNQSEKRTRAQQPIGEAERGWRGRAA